MTTCVPAKTADYCYRAICGIPQTFEEAMRSANSEEWREAMDEEVQLLNEQNKTFTATTQPKGMKTARGRWVYAIKNDADGKEK